MDFPGSLTKPEGNNSLHNTKGEELNSTAPFLVEYDSSPPTFRRKPSENITTVSNPECIVPICSTSHLHKEKRFPLPSSINQEEYGNVCNLINDLEKTKKELSYLHKELLRLQKEILHPQHKIDIIAKLEQERIEIRAKKEELWKLNKHLEERNKNLYKLLQARQIRCRYLEEQVTSLEISENELKQEIAALKAEIEAIRASNPENDDLKKQLQEQSKIMSELGAKNATLEYEDAELKRKFGLLTTQEGESTQSTSLATANTGQNLHNMKGEINTIDSNLPTPQIKT